MKQELLQELGLPSVPHVVYDHPPLALALCQIQFARVLGIAERVGRFQDEVAEIFPFAASGEQIEIELGDVPPNAVIGSPKREQQWRFSDSQNTWTVVLASSFVSLETRAYGDFQDFLRRLNDVILALTKIVKPKVLTRVGLRYINEIRINPQPTTAIEWEPYIQKDLLGSLTVPAIGQKAILTQQQVILRYANNQGVNIIHGLLTDGTTVKPLPGEVAPSGPFYLLDLDVYREFPTVRQQPLIAQKLVEYIREYNQVIYRLFRWSVTDNYIATLRERS